MFIFLIFFIFYFYEFVVALGARPHTLSGLSGIGDLMLTCYGTLSRNRTVGVRLGQGESLAQIKQSMGEVAEGVATTPAAVQLAAKLGVNVPIINAVGAVLEGKEKPMEAVRRLMLVRRTKARAHARTAYLVTQYCVHSFF